MKDRTLSGMAGLLLKKNRNLKLFLLCSIANIDTVIEEGSMALVVIILDTSNPGIGD